MLMLWRELFQGRSATAREAIDQAILDSNRPFRDLLHEFAKDRGGTLSSRRLGKWLHGKEGRIVDIGAQDHCPVKFERDGEMHGSVLWKVVDAAP